MFVNKGKHICKVSVNVYDVSISKPFGEKLTAQIYIIKVTNQVSPSSGFQVPHCIEVKHSFHVWKVRVVISRSGQIQDIIMGSYRFQCYIQHQSIAQQQVDPCLYTVTCGLSGFCLLV